MATAKCDPRPRGIMRVCDKASRRVIGAMPWTSVKFHILIVSNATNGRPFMPCYSNQEVLVFTGQTPTPCNGPTKNATYTENINNSTNNGPISMQITSKSSYHHGAMGSTIYRFNRSGIIIENHGRA